MTHVAVLCVRDEGAFLLDWIAHHSAVGFDHFVVCSNACSDGTDAMLDRLAEIGFVTHIRNDGPYEKRGVQFTGLKHAGALAVVKEADWLLALDIDEFVNIHCGGHRLADLHAAVPEADAITLTWRLFGNDGVRDFVDRPVTEQFTHAAPRVMHWPWRAAFFKTLYRNDGTYGSLGVHRPRRPNAGRISAFHWFDGSGRELGEGFRNRRIFSDYGQDNHGLVQLNHYALGAMQSYVLKAARGRAVHGGEKLGMDYWVERNFNAEEDRSIAALAGPVADMRTELAADAVLAELHGQAVAWRRKRFEALMLEEPYRALYGRLLMTPSSTPLAQTDAEPMIRFGRLSHSAGQETP